jgi:hypothetical protein
MPTRQDRKGKFYTEKVTKNKIRVTIQTATNLLQGHIHVRPDLRLRDALNDGLQFIAVTNGKVLNKEGEGLYRFDFLALNRDQVVWILPDENDTAQKGQGSRS